MPGRSAKADRRKAVRVRLPRLPLLEASKEGKEVDPYWDDTWAYDLAKNAWTKMDYAGPITTVAWNAPTTRSTTWSSSPTSAAASRIGTRNSGPPVNFIVPSSILKSSLEAREGAD